MGFTFNKVLISFSISDPEVKLRQKSQLKTYSRQRQGLVPRDLFPITISASQSEPS